MLSSKDGMWWGNKNKNNHTHKHTHTHNTHTHTHTPKNKLKKQWSYTQSSRFMVCICQCTIALYIFYITYTTGDHQSKFSWGATINPMFSCCSVPHLNTFQNYNESHAEQLQHSPPEHSSKLQWIPRSAAVVFLTWTLLETTMNPMQGCCSIPYLNTPQNYYESHV